MTVFSTPLTVWVLGTWTSQLLDISLQSFPDSTDNKWGELKWLETNTTDEATAKIRIDVLDSDDVVRQKELAGNTILNDVSGRFNKSIDLSKYSNIATRDIKLRFKLFHLSGSKPTVDNIELKTKNDW